MKRGNEGLLETYVYWEICREANQFTKAPVNFSSTKFSTSKFWKVGKNVTRVTTTRQ